MAWKPKEKPLTPEEAIALARRELAPRWSGGTPLLAAIRGEGHVNAYPIDPSFAQHSWLLLFVDPLDVSGEACLELLREWHHRYSPYALSFIAVLRSGYSFTSDPAYLKALVVRGLPYPVTLDSDGLLAEAFGASARPKAILMGHGRKAVEISGPKWHEGLETSIQKFLREKDRGLPLLPEFQVPAAAKAVEARVEMGFRLGVKVTSDPNGRISIRKAVPSKFKTGEFFISGTWTQTEERLETSDPEASIGFYSAASRVSLVAQAMVTTAEVTPIAVELGGIPAYDCFAGSNLIPADDGRSVVLIGKAGLYHVLRDLPADERDVVFRFPSARECPVGIYGFRLSEY
jgi:hypothetical protein